MNKSIYIHYPHTYNGYLVTTDSTEVIRKLITYYGSLVLDSFQLNAADITINYLYGKLSIMHIDTVVLGPIASSNIDLIVCNIIMYIRNNLKIECDWNMYHASSVLVQNKVRVLLGPTSSGKTTLATFLKYQPNTLVISEDVTLLNYKTLELVPINRPLLLRKESYDLLTSDYHIDLGQVDMITFNNNERVFPMKNITTLNNASLMIDEIVCLHLQKNANSKIRTYDINKLILNSFSATDNFRNIRSAISLSKRIPMYDMYYYDLNLAYEVLCSNVE